MCKLEPIIVQSLSANFAVRLQCLYMVKMLIKTGADGGKNKHDCCWQFESDINEELSMNYVMTLTPADV